jgi:formylglycine-generating enzyme required for sulfatase activity
MAGREIRPVARAGELSLCGRISARGLGAVVAGAPAALGKDFHDFLAAQARLQARADWSTAFPARVAVLKQHPSARGHRSPPPGMVEIPAATMTLRVEFRVRECGFYESSSDHFASPGGHPLHQLKSFDRQVSLRRFAVDLTPVTNGQFAQFLQATGYRPRRPENFLKHWRQGAPPPELAEHPVVYVSPEDARAFARWAGKRLPTEEEWQYAAQGNDRRRYPWGNEFKPGLCNAGETGATTAVRAFPGGRSPFGCYDMCGNVWEWTESERTDGRTRFCIIRGGAYYRAKGSAWYMDGGPQSCEFAAKFLLAWPGLDRCATIGFRCAADLSA